MQLGLNYGTGLSYRNGTELWNWGSIMELALNYDLGLNLGTGTELWN